MMFLSLLFIYLTYDDQAFTNAASSIIYTTSPPQPRSVLAQDGQEWILRISKGVGPWVSVISCND